MSEGLQDSVPSEPRSAGASGDICKAPVEEEDEYSDGRPKWQWRSKYDRYAHHLIQRECCILLAYFGTSVVLSAIFLGFGDSYIRFNIGPDVAFSLGFYGLAVFAGGCAGGTTYSIKWLIHAVATGRWHLDRRLWRLLVPLMGGAYACVVLKLFDSGFLGGQGSSEPRPLLAAAAFAFLVGYFSDGVSGLLSNMASAVFGTVKKK